MTRLAQKHSAINLAQGFPDFPAPETVKAAACAAINENVNQYSVTWGSESLRSAIADKYWTTYNMRVNPETELCVTCGSTEAMLACLLGLVDPGDEVIIFEPFYENYFPDAKISGAVPRYVALHPPDWRFREEELSSAFCDRTRLIIINSPNNPTGRVFTRDELTLISRLCVKYGVIACTDEIYEHIVYDGARHIPIGRIPGMEDRTVTISSLSKTYSVTGWRVGWAIGPAELMSAVRKVHDFITVGAPSPLQEAGAVALQLPDTYYARLIDEYTDRRDLLMGALNQAGMPPMLPEGAYYILADVGDSGADSDQEAALVLLNSCGVAAVPGSSFFATPSAGRRYLRFAFSKRRETLVEAGRRLQKWSPG